MFVVLRVAATLGPSAGQHPAGHDALDRLRRSSLKERQHAVVHHLGGGDRGFYVVQLGEADFRTGVDHGLLANPAHIFQGADMKAVLRHAATGTLAVELTLRLSSLALIRFAAQARATTCALVSTAPSCAIFTSQAFSRFFMFSRACRCQTQRTPNGEMDRPR